ncbi:unnamed protein product, partial [Discosporangium mesarthrocarpum]
MFLAEITRPDLSNSVRELGCQAASPSLHHWRGLQHLLHYLRRSMNFRLHYPRGLNNDHRRLLNGYADSGWANASETRRSVTGYLLLFNGSHIVWGSKLRGPVTLTRSEAEWAAMAHGMPHCIFIWGILTEMGITQ